MKIRISLFLLLITLTSTAAESKKSEVVSNQNSNQQEIVQIKTILDATAAENARLSQVVSNLKSKVETLQTEVQNLRHAVLALGVSQKSPILLRDFPVYPKPENDDYIFAIRMINADNLDNARIALESMLSNYSKRLIETKKDQTTDQNNGNNMLSVVQMYYHILYALGYIAYTQQDYLSAEKYFLMGLDRKTDKETSITNNELLQDFIFAMIFTKKMLGNTKDACSYKKDLLSNLSLNNQEMYNDVTLRLKNTLVGCK